MGFSWPQSGGRKPPVGSGSNIVTLLTELSGVTHLDVAAYRITNNRISTWGKNNPRTVSYRRKQRFLKLVPKNAANSEQVSPPPSKKNVMLYRRRFTVLSILCSG